MTVVETPADWRKLSVLDPKTGNFGRQLEALTTILQGLGEDPPPVIDTVFNVFGYAQKVCGGKAVFVLEGGYHLDGLRDSVREVLKAMKGEAPAGGRNGSMKMEADSRLIEPILKKVKETHKSNWKNL